ncbi:hypothetical protein GPJ56_006352 [Histomonas meleagridis]|uniref:uncharacterized protein n=1 Tax=Histomonas meleagridis TaxID=135588 RepID=UPI003559571B|nr:hypothetical protein GPJ56_006352 [Histomonas meleagridis]KAH0796831.1 hypothetical protein GO595_010724 [Histomonas meleagridis]
MQKIEEINALKEFLQSQKIPEITVSACNGNILAFAGASQPFPYFYYFDEGKVKVPDQSQQRRLSFETVTSINISKDSKYVITCHSNGQVLVWDTKLHIHVASFLVTEQMISITLSVFQEDSAYLFVVLNNFQLHRLKITSQMGFLTITSDSKVEFDSRISDIKAAATDDLYTHLLALAFQDRVLVLKSSKTITQISSFSFVNPMIAFTGNGIKFYLAVVSNNTDFQIIQISESGVSKQIFQSKFTQKINFFTFITPDFLAVSTDNISIYHITGKVAQVISIDFPANKIYPISDDLIIPPYHKITLTNWMTHLTELLSSHQYQTALQESIDLFTKKSLHFYCPCTQEEIKEFIKNCITKMVTEGINDPSQVSLITYATIATNLTEYLLRFVTQNCDKITQQLLIIGLFESKSLQTELPSKIIRIASKFDDFDHVAIENVLLNVTFPPSFTEELIKISTKQHFHRLLIQHFRVIYRDISPAFGYIINIGTDEEISFICQYIFLSGIFTLEEYLKCILLLFSSNYQYLHRCFKSDWELAPQYMKLIFENGPYIDNNGQIIGIKDMITISFLCFKNAIKGKADSLFTFLAKMSLNNDVSIPKESYDIVMSFIFESTTPLSIREKLFLRIVDIDFKGICLLKDHIELCIAAGFSKVVKLLLKDTDDYESIITSMLLSDAPNDALTFLEDETLSKENAKHALCTNFLPLLFLDPKKFVNLLITRFPELHPNFIRSMNNSSVTQLYYEQLFEFYPKFATNEDASFYLEFLSTYSIKLFVDFLRKKNTCLNDEDLYEFCAKRKSYIGTAVLCTMNHQWDSAFKSYLLHLQNNNNYFDKEISTDLISNISSINENSSIIIRSIFRPIIMDDPENNAELIEEFIDIVKKQIDIYQVIVAILPLYVSCPNSKTKVLLEKFINTFACCLLIDEVNDEKLFSNIKVILKISKNKKLSSGKLSVIDEKDGITMLSTMGENGDKMDEEIVENVKDVFQRAESVFVSNGKRIPQDEDACVVLLLNQ